MALAAGGWCVTAICPNGRCRPGLARCPSRSRLCIGLLGNGWRCPGCGNAAGQKTIRGMVFPTNAPEGGRLTFTSTILPPYLRRAKSIEELLPWLYLKGISTGDFSDAQAALPGPDAPGLSASTITRLKADWWDE